MSVGRQVEGSPQVGLGAVTPLSNPLRMAASHRAKYAVNSIKKKVNDKNPHVALYALEVSILRVASPGMG